MLDPNVKSVIDKFRTRAKAGFKKYGVDTTRTDLTTLDWLNHAQDEAMDFCIYLERLKQDFKVGTIHGRKSRSRDTNTIVPTVQEFRERWSEGTIVPTVQEFRERWSEGMKAWSKPIKPPKGKLVITRRLK